MTLQRLLWLLIIATVSVRCARAWSVIRDHRNALSDVADAVAADANTDAIARPRSDAASRRAWLLAAAAKTSAAASIAVISIGAPIASAAPPFAVMAEELGYFPVRNQEGNVVYVPKAVTRPSTEQAVRLAERMKDQKVTMYGAYWCPHCARQKDVFGREAWDILLTSGRYVECSPKGYGYRGLCLDVDGYPTFQNPRRTINVSGELPLDQIAKIVGFKGFDPALEDFVPMIGTTCKIR